MSLYRAEDIIGHSTGEVKSSSRELQNPTHQEPTSKSESQSPDVSSHSFSSTAPIRSDYPEEYANKSMPSDYPPHKPPGATSEYPPKPPVEFTPKPMEQPYHSKQLQSDSDRVHQSDVDDNYSKMEPRHPHPSPGGVPFPGQPRFLPGQGMSQPTGTTPTLNQLLQASSPVHRFHSNYPTIGSEGYQQPWPMQRPIGPPVYPPSQRPPQTGSPSLHHGPGGPGTPPMPYQSYNQRFPAPARPHSPYSHHQLNVPPGHSSNLYGDQRGWNQGASSHSPLPPLVNQANSSSQSPQRALSQSPAPPSASPQPQPPNQQPPPPPPQNFHGIQQRATTPNTQGIDSGELSGQNSNDSSNGPAGPATPNSQSMRPTPSPTGSTGSRSMSPAVVQPTIQMPPRPSSSQSDGGSGPARMSLSPLATQAANEDATFAPKVRKEVMGYHSHPPTPQSTAPSPGAASMNSAHEDYPDMNSPSWPRTSASPVYNAHIPQDPYRSKKSDSLSKLYEMDDSMERRTFLDKLIGFMEERRTPITTCPTISKNPLDLFRLYLSVKERGGFMEVTKNKTWKDVAGLLGIGASSSAAYTLRKHYTKHLLAFECHFDRGGVDPQPIISQFEGSSKKKGAKSTSSVPSPGSSNSQDSFPAGSTNTSMDGYGSYQSNYSANATSGGTNVDYNSVPSRPPSQSNTPHQSMQQPNYQNSSVYPNYPQDQYNRPQGGSMPMQNDFAQPFSARPHYSPYDAERTYPGGNMPPSNQSSPDVYNRYSGNQQSGGYSNTTPPVNRAPFSGTPPGHAPNSQQPIPAQNTTPPQSTSGGNYSYPQDYYRSAEHGNFGPSVGSPVYTNTSTSSKNMPPPPPGAQQPRRHPDFVKEQQYPSYGAQRPVYPGWPAGSNQYSGGSVRMPYPNQQMQPSPQHQPLQQNQATPTPPVSTPMGINNNQQWNNQQSVRPPPPPQTNINPPSHPPAPWDNRYNQTPSLYTAPGTHQSQLGMNPMLNQQTGIKKDMIFPPETVESTTPLLNKRRKLTRSDVSPVEAWRIMMALRSGLLAESCWALDVLNILLFDDSSVHYFGLTHLPGLLDVLLEHFSRSLADMFDTSLEDHGFYKKSIRHPIIDLGAITKPIDSEDRIKLLTSLNYTLQSRRGKPVKVVPRDDEIFILDNRRSWDPQDFESDVEPWQYDESTISYIVKCFESEINKVAVKKEKEVKDEKLNDLPEETSKSVDSDIKTDSCDKKPIVIVENKVEESKTVEETLIKVTKIQQEKKKKTKSLSDVLSRIKKEPVEPLNDLTRELFVKKNDGSKKESENISNSTDSSKTDLTSSSKTTSKQQNGLSDFSNKLPTKTSEETLEKTEPESDDKSEEKPEEKSEETPSKDDKENSNEEVILPKLNVRDPAGTLKRRRASDYEDENYSRDEASLYLVTETQDNLARRCVCLSTILRNLTFIPGNEMEFARNVTFLSLMGKLLLLHHEHPTRAQKTRNYDREEDADFADSCSSLQGENEWWWDFLYYIRENVLVMAANISGHVDLSQYTEEISRPVLDGLLHWAVCPAAHGQDPFPTVGLNSSLSPQRLALEALCKLCVTENNVDLIVATPPYSRLEKLCSVLSRLLCRSEEQVLREFGVNLLHFLSAADSGVARTIALQTPCVALLVAFIEQAENSAIGVANQHGIAALRDNPETMGTSLDMLRRAAGTLLNLSRHPDNRTLLLQHESRLLALVMSQILDQQVAAIVARVLFQCSRGTSTT